MSANTFRERDDEIEIERDAKRAKISHEIQNNADNIGLVEPETTSNISFEDLLPSSKVLLPHKGVGWGEHSGYQVSEPDVGISEYISDDVPRIEGIIKQRFTDFMVFEVDIQHQVVRLKSIVEPPQLSKVGDEDIPPPRENVENKSGLLNVTAAVEDQIAKIPDEKGPCLEANTKSTETEPWPLHFNDSLTPFLSVSALEELKLMFLQGSNPPFGKDRAESDPLDSSMGPVQNVTDAQQEKPVDTATLMEKAQEGDNSRKNGNDRRKRGRGGGTRASGKKDNRKVISEPITSKQDRTALHEIIRTLFRGKLETETERSGAEKEDGQRIIIKWSKSKGGNVKRGNREAAIAQGGRENPFPYIHLTMQKTNRDTQDALSYLARMLHCNVKDLCVAGTKDKRGVTTQRVSFKRNGRTIQEVWKTVNGITARRTVEQAVTERGERGIRIGDLAYRKSFLELGMLKGNAFVITLRNVKADSLETIDRALTSLKVNGFINYYGMQRFGTSSIPTHSIGLALLRSDWAGAVSLILRPRPGEYPDADAARRAWLQEKNLEKALALMPRRVVAERCILENFYKQGGDDRNALGAISTVPKNLRLMYIHAYQSYVWNAIVSERIKSYGLKPIVGDLVFDVGGLEEIEEDPAQGDGETDPGVMPTEPLEDVTLEDERTATSSGRTGQRGQQPRRIKVLGPGDLEKYTIFDVVVPLPGTDVAYPKGELGEKYREFLRVDGLDPDNFKRKQRDYTLGGSYRKMLHLPKELSWSTMRYTDPDLALAQSDEDRILGFEPPADEEEGPFLAVQIRMQLGTAAYATMALREITKTDTSSHYQTTLTQISDDQKYKGNQLGL